MCIDLELLNDIRNFCDDELIDELNERIKCIIGVLDRKIYVNSTDENSKQKVAKLSEACLLLDSIKCILNSVEVK